MFYYSSVNAWCKHSTWERVYRWEEFWSVHLLMTEFGHPEVTLSSWQDIKIQLLTNLLWDLTVPLSQERDGEAVARNRAGRWSRRCGHSAKVSSRLLSSYCQSPLCMQCVMCTDCHPAENWCNRQSLRVEDGQHLHDRGSGRITSANWVFCEFTNCAACNINKQFH